MPKMIVGAQLYTVRSFCKTLDGIAQSLKKVKDIGYTAVQVSGFGQVDPKEVAKVLADSGLTVASTHISWQGLRGDPDGVIAQHRLWNCRHPAVGGLPEEYYTPDGVRKFLDELAPLAGKLAAAGMDFSYHNHSHELIHFGPKTWLELLYEQADRAQLKAEIDTYWIQHGGGDPAWWVRRCAGREPLLHLKDMVVVGDGEQRFAEVGEGNLNWAAILKAAADGGVEYLLVEQDKTYDLDPFESLAISYRNLRAMGVG